MTNYYRFIVKEPDPVGNSDYIIDLSNGSAFLNYYDEESQDAALMKVAEAEGFEEVILDLINNFTDRTPRLLYEILVFGLYRPDEEVKDQGSWKTMC